MGKSKSRRSQHRKKKRVEKGQDSSSSSEGSYSDSDTSEELTRSNRKRKATKRPSISIIPDDDSLDVGNDDLYPAREIRFKDWDAHILANLEHKRDLGLSQLDKERWDNALDEMISLRRIYNERRRTGREDIEVPRALVEKSVQTVNEVEDVGIQVTFEDVAETRPANLSSHPSSSGKSLSNEKSNGNVRNGSERGEGCIGVIQTKVEGDEDESYWSFATSFCLLVLFCLEKEPQDCNTQNQVVIIDSDFEDVGSPFSSRKKKSYESSTTSEEVHSTSPEASSRRLRRRKAHPSKHQGHAKLKNTAIMNRNYSSSDTSEPDGEPTLPNLPTCYMNRRIRILKGRKRCLTEDEFLTSITENVTAPVIAILGPSGMGKTAFLAQMGRNILCNIPGRKLFYLNMMDVVGAVKAEKSDINVYINKEDAAWAGIRHLAKEIEMAEAIPTPNAPHSIPRTELFLDGFDKVHSRDWGLVCEILKCISESYQCNGIRLWVAIVPNDFNKIEKVLQKAENYSLEPLGYDSQVDLIVSYLELHTSEDKPRLYKFVNKCVTDLSSSQLGLGNPLQCLLVGAACVKLEQADSSKSTLIMSKNILNINSKTNWLSNAASLRSFHTLELIFNLNKFNINSEGGNGYIPLFSSVCERGNVDCLSKFKFLLGKGGNLNHKINNGDNLLLVATRFAPVECLKYILGLNKLDINCKDKYNGSTPLFRSVEGIDDVNGLEKLKLILQHKPNLNHINNDNLNLLLQAARYSTFDCFSYILSLKKFDINCVDSNGNTPLFLATSGDGNHDAQCLAKLKGIIKHKPNLNHLNYDKSNLLLYAAQFSSADVLEYILSLNKFDINSEDDEGDTPLLLSVFRYDGVDCLKKLEMIRGQGGNLGHVNKKGLNLLHRAVQHASVKVLKYVIDLGKFDINSRDKFGKSALHYAKIKVNKEGVRNVDMEAKVKLLIEKGCTE